MSSEKLANKFIELTRGQVLYPPVSGMSIFAPRLSGYIFGGYYHDATPAPYLTIMRQGRGASVFLSETKFKNISREIFIKYWGKYKFLKSNALLARRYIEVLNKIYSKASYDYFESASLTELAAMAKKTVAANRHVNTTVWFTVYFDKEFCRRLLEELKVNISIRRFEMIWSKATIPTFESFEASRNLFIYKLLSKKIKWPEIAGQCQYFFANYNAIKSLKAVKFELRKMYGSITSGRAKDLLKQASEKKKINLLNYKKWLATLNHDEKKLAIWLQEIIRLRNARKDAVSKALTVVYRVAERMFRETGLSEDLIMYCSCDEIAKGIKYLNENKEKIKIRPRGIVMLFFEDKNNFVEFEYGTYEETKRKLEKYYNRQIFFNQIKSNLGEIKGQAACRGKAKGIVRIISDPGSAKNFKKGDILVTSMTRPEFIALIKLAAAIVTDEGGITCHAAIVSRELSIPCVIGTRIATKVLHDGDLVEVDADKGVVKILKRVKK